MVARHSYSLEGSEELWVYKMTIMTQYIILGNSEKYVTQNRLPNVYVNKHSEILSKILENQLMNKIPVLVFQLFNSS